VHYPTGARAIEPHDWYSSGNCLSSGTYKLESLDFTNMTQFWQAGWCEVYVNDDNGIARGVPSAIFYTKYDSSEVSVTVTDVGCTFFSMYSNICLLVGDYYHYYYHIDAINLPRGGVKLIGRFPTAVNPRSRADNHSLQSAMREQANCSVTLNIDAPPGNLFTRLFKVYPYMFPISNESDHGIQIRYEWGDMILLPHTKQSLDATPIALRDNEWIVDLATTGYKFILKYQDSCLFINSERARAKGRPDEIIHIQPHSSYKLTFHNNAAVSIGSRKNTLGTYASGIYVEYHNVKAIPDDSGGYAFNYEGVWEAPDFQPFRTELPKSHTHDDLQALAQ